MIRAANNCQRDLVLWADLLIPEASTLPPSFFLLFPFSTLISVKYRTSKCFSLIWSHINGLSCLAHCSQHTGVCEGF